MIPTSPEGSYPQPKKATTGRDKCQINQQLTIKWIRKTLATSPEIAAAAIEDASFQHLLKEAAVGAPSTSELTQRFLLILNELFDRRAMQEIALDE